SVRRPESFALSAVSAEDLARNRRGIRATAAPLQEDDHHDLWSRRWCESGKPGVTGSGARLARDMDAGRRGELGAAVSHRAFQAFAHPSELRLGALVRQAAPGVEQLQRRDLDAPLADGLQLELLGSGCGGYRIANAAQHAGEFRRIERLRQMREVA